jgi:hypothetical protein
MPVQGNPIAQAGGNTLTTASLRKFIRDYVEKNHLLDEVEFSDSEIEEAIVDTVEHANIIGRLTSWTAQTMPHRYILKLGATAYLLTSEAVRQARNQASYQDGNIQPIGIDDKAQLYLNMAGQLRTEFTNLVTQVKIAANMTATGSLSSPLREV